MAQPLPRLRMDLEFMPSPVPDRPGLLIRDPQQYSDVTLIIPPPLVECLRYYDGASTDADLREFLVRITGSFEVSDLMGHLHQTLRDAGFLDDELSRNRRERRRREFAAALTREATHAGSAYPAEPAGLAERLERCLGADRATAVPDGFLGIAAPHVSLDGGDRIYGAAYRALSPELRDRVFVLLGTSHYGAPDRFGLTRKNFRTPLGEARTATRLVDRLAAAAPGAVELEDYCHLAEHSIEFQVIFLQHILGPGVRIVPILCGAYARSLYQGGAPEDNDSVRAFLAELGEIAATEGDRLAWVLGVDMAHMGSRYGDSFPAVAHEGIMQKVAERDRRRIELITRNDPEGFWRLVQENHDDLKWCGSSAFYTFLRAVPQARGRLLDYDQWSIDEQSAVSFGALAFAVRQGDDEEPETPRGG